MRRDIISIDESRCNGCGLCISSCHEGALALVDGKARLISETYCDGLGACLPECPAGAIRIVSREAADFDETAVQARMPQQEQANTRQRPDQRTGAAGSANSLEQQPVSELHQWPVQIKLMSAGSPCLDHARLLIAADCTAYARADFHQEFMRGRITLIGCPKLDQVSYAGKLAEIFRQHEIKSIMVVRMEVPCCGGLDHAVMQALQDCGKMIPCQVVTLGIDGSISKSSGGTHHV